MGSDKTILTPTKSRKGGKKGRKVGRQRKSLSHQRYTAEKRWITNRARRVKRNINRQAILKARSAEK